MQTIWTRCRRSDQGKGAEMNMNDLSLSIGSRHPIDRRGDGSSPPLQRIDDKAISVADRHHQEKEGERESFEAKFNVLPPWPTSSERYQVTSTRPSPQSEPSPAQDRDRCLEARCIQEKCLLRASRPSSVDLCTPAEGEHGRGHGNRLKRKKTEEQEAAHWGKKQSGIPLRHTPLRSSSDSSDDGTATSMFSSSAQHSPSRCGVATSCDRSIAIGSATSTEETPLLLSRKDHLVTNRSPTSRTGGGCAGRSPCHTVLYRHRETAEATQSPSNLGGNAAQYAITLLSGTPQRKSCDRCFRMKTKVSQKVLQRQPSQAVDHL